MPGNAVTVDFSPAGYQKAAGGRSAAQTTGAGKRAAPHPGGAEAFLTPFQGVIDFRCLPVACAPTTGSFLTARWTECLTQGTGSVLKWSEAEAHPTLNA
jgi:hypothetical protein